MDISVNKSKSNVIQSAPVSHLLQTVREFVRRLAGLFILTDEDRKKAGIYTVGKEHDG